MKVCKDCGIEKDNGEFYGVQNECKDCTKSRVKRNREKVGTKYDFSEKGVFRVIYKTQKRNQKLRGHGELPYSKDQLVEWCKANGFDDLFKEWVNSGHDNKLKPSIDRINDFHGYSFDNIKLGTWMENRLHQIEDIKSGSGTGGARCKAVIKMNANMEVICEYVSFNAAKRDEGYHMEYSIKNGTMCKKGFYWKYK